jgi:hypothetical protein
MIHMVSISLRGKEVAWIEVEVDRLNVRAGEENANAATGEVKVLSATTAEKPRSRNDFIVRICCC